MTRDIIINLENKNNGGKKNRNWYIGAIKENNECLAYIIARV